LRTAAVVIDSEKVLILAGDSMATDFVDIFDDYVARTFTAHAG
jgi:hypothetical protein